MSDTLLRYRWQGLPTGRLPPVVMQFVSRSVIISFVNSLAVLIFVVQLPQLTNVGWETYAMVAGGLVAIIYLFPRLTKAVPSPLVAILLVLSAVNVTLGGCAAAVRRSPPGCYCCSCWRCSAPSSTACRCRAGRGDDHGFDRHVQLELDSEPAPPSADLVDRHADRGVGVVATRDLSLGVLAGVLLSGVFFASKVQRMFAVEREASPDAARAIYRVTGQIFFAWVDRFTRAFRTEIGRDACVNRCFRDAFLGYLGGGRGARQDRRSTAPQGAAAPSKSSAIIERVRTSSISSPVTTRQGSKAASRRIRRTRTAALIVIH